MQVNDRLPDLLTSKLERLILMSKADGVNGELIFTAIMRALFAVPR
jgi:hypothetical protein